MSFGLDAYDSSSDEREEDDNGRNNNAQDDDGNVKSTANKKRRREEEEEEIRKEEEKCTSTFRNAFATTFIVRNENYRGTGRAQKKSRAKTVLE